MASQQPTQQQPVGAQQTTGQYTQGATTGQYGQQQAASGQRQQQPAMQGRLGPQQRSALYGVVDAIEVCEWCADQCIQEGDPNMLECIRLCEDVSELGELTLALAPRNSRFAGTVAQTFQQAAQACLQECSRHPHNHCQECTNVLGQVVTTTQSLVQSGQQMGGMQAQTQGTGQARTGGTRGQATTQGQMGGMQSQFQ